MLLFDPQTSGGLLMSVPPASLPVMTASAAKAGQMLWEVGEVVEDEGIEVLQKR
jgi:selenide,water dikinase